MGSFRTRPPVGASHTARTAAAMWRTAGCPTAGISGSCSTSSLREHGLELGLELALRVGADDLLGDLPVLEHDQRGDREDLVLRRRLLVLVGVELDDLQILALAGDLLEYGGDDTAGTAPRRPEVDEDRGVGLDDLGYEGGVGDLDDF